MESRERWTHDPPCALGGYTEVSPLVVRDGRCPLCRAALVEPDAVREARERRETTDARLEAAWRPHSPREILSMAADA